MKEFFDHVRKSFGPLTQNQVDGFNIILAATDGMDIRHRAYILATAWHETARTMQPIEEYGKGAGRPYSKQAGPYGHRYYGRGYVQLTWLDNYEKAGKKLGVDLVRHPEKALEPDIAARILVRGMVEGWFTGKKLADYTDYPNMRRIVNGMDKAGTITGHAEKFETALSASPEPVQPVPEPEAVSARSKLIAALTALAAAAAAVVAALMNLNVPTN